MKKFKIRIGIKNTKEISAHIRYIIIDNKKIKVAVHKPYFSDGDKNFKKLKKSFKNFLVVSDYLIGYTITDIFKNTIFESVPKSLKEAKKIIIEKGGYDYYKNCLIGKEVINK